MSDIAFTREEKEVLVAKLQQYFDDELGIELGQFDGDFLLDFISKEMGASFYPTFRIKFRNKSLGIMCQVHQ